MKGFFTQHPLMKLIALTLSVALWWFVRSERQNEKTVDIPVMYKNVPQDFIFSGPLQETIRLRLRGSQAKLAKVDKHYFSSHIIDLSKSAQGPNSFWLYEEDFGLPFGVYVSQIFPQAIRVVLEPKERRRIPVHPRYAGELPPGIEIEEVFVSPKTVGFESHQAELDKIAFFYTEPINLTNRVKDFEGDYFVDTTTYRGVLSEEKVKVTFDLIEKEIKETIPAVPITLPIVDPSIFLEPDTVEIMVEGPLSSVLKAVKTPPVVGVDVEQFNKALAVKKDTQISVVFESVEDLKLLVKPDKVWLRFR